jgi:hypothetical protein
MLIQYIYWSMNKWTQGYCLTKKIRGKKSRETVFLKGQLQEKVHEIMTLADGLVLN